MNYTAVVSVSLKDSILDPAGRVLLDNLGKLGYDTVTDVRAGKQFRLRLSGERSEVEAQLAEFANGVLANPVIETVEWDLQEAEG